MGRTQMGRTDGQTDRLTDGRTSNNCFLGYKGDIHVVGAYLEL